MPPAGVGGAAGLDSAHPLGMLRCRSRVQPRVMPAGEGTTQRRGCSGQAGRAAAQAAALDAAVGAPAVARARKRVRRFKGLRLISYLIDS